MDFEFELLLNDFHRRKKYIDGLHTNSNYTALAHLWLIKQTLHSRKWRFVSDEDETLMKAFYRTFKNEILSDEVHHFLCKVDRDKKLPEAYKEHITAASKLKAWGELNGFEKLSLNKLASLKVMLELQGKPLYKVLSDGTQTYKVWQRVRLNIHCHHRIKGFFLLIVQRILDLIRMNMSPICY